MWKIANKKDERSNPIHLELLSLAISSNIIFLNTHSSRIGNTVTEIIRTGKEKVAISTKMFSVDRRGPHRLTTISPTSNPMKNVRTPNMMERVEIRIHSFLVAFFVCLSQTFGFSTVK